MREYLLVFLIAAGTTYLLAGAARLLALKTNTLAQVRARDVHTVAIPYFGGLAMMGGLAVSVQLATEMPFLSRHAAVAHDAAPVLWAAFVICIVGILDDKYDLPAMVKLGGQVLAAGVAVVGGVRIYWIPLPNLIFSPDDASSILLTLLFIAVCVNAVNFVDGLDGLAAGVIAIGSGAFFSYTYLLAYEEGLTAASTASLLTIITCGICVGFLGHNFNPARMFMGDSGAMLLGLLMAMSAITFTGQIDSSTLGQSGSEVLPALLPVLLPLAALALPFTDLILAYIRRTMAGQHWFVADKQHLHHRLLARGHSHRGAVFLMYAWTALVSFGLVLLALDGSRLTPWILGLAVILIAVLTIWPVKHPVDAPDGSRGALEEVASPASADPAKDLASADSTHGNQ